MSNTSNATLTPVNDARARRPRPRLAPLILLLLALLYGGLALPWTARTFGPAAGSDEQSDVLSLAGPIAETIEEAQAETEAPDIALYADLITPLFTDEDALAYVRVWSPKQQLIFEVTRDLYIPRGGNGGRLPELGITTALDPLQPLVKDDAWVEAVGRLQALEQAQGDITTLLDDIATAEKPNPAAINHAIVAQDNTLKLAESLRDAGLPVADAVADMQRVFDVLTGPAEDKVTLALGASEDVDGDLTLALTSKRARQDTIAMLPPLLAQSEPGPPWPFLRGRRVVVPLFTPAANDLLVAHSGYAEIVVFDRPLNAMLALAALPAVVLLLAALLTLLTGRPKGTKKVRPVYEDVGGEW